jgi:hypothetical protein
MYQTCSARCSSPTHLVDLSPFLGGLFCEAFVDHGHDLIEDLTVAWSDIEWFVYWRMAGSY